MKHPGTRLFLILLFLLLTAFAGCRSLPPVGQEDTSNAGPDAQAIQPSEPLLPFGNPSGANADDQDNYLLVHDSHVLSYNASRGTLNWAAWWTRRSDVGKAIPRHQFEPDMKLPAGSRRIQYYDYSGSGYDRGHIVPSADRFGNAELNAQTFLMTNIVPQTPELNQFPWNELEYYARGLVFKGSELYTIAGVYGNSGTLRRHVTVPSNCWKVIVVFSPGGQVGAITPSTRIIAVDMPNVAGLRTADWHSYRTSIRDIEKKAGVDLLSMLPRSLQDAIETSVDKH